MESRSQHPLPLHSCWKSTGEYIESLLSFVTETDLLRNLCGGVHILDFLTREPDLYSYVLPSDWREWFDLIETHDILDLLLREDLEVFAERGDEAKNELRWRGYAYPPQDLVQYIHAVRIHSLKREFQPVSPYIKPLPRHISVGMRPKKVHEVTNFAAYVDQLAACISSSISVPLSIIDFGSGQNYLGRTLACPPYNKHVIAIEQRHHNVEGAKGMDILAKLTEKEKLMRNKKEYKKQLALMKETQNLPLPSPETTSRVQVTDTPTGSGVHTPTVETVPEVIDAAHKSAVGTTNADKGSVTYIKHALESGYLEDILKPDTAPNAPSPPPSSELKSLVVSIHSCGNLTHHGLRSISLNPSVQAVAMIGCCYNLLTERLGPVTYKHPQLRPKHPRLESTGSAFDPHGFPMSRRFEDFEYNVTTGNGSTKKNKNKNKGVRLNITARMMAVQAPYNWGRDDSEMYFTRHFYRALLQRIFLDRGVVKQAVVAPEHVVVAGGSLSGKDTEGTPLVIGSLRKQAFTSFRAYVRAALEKVTVGNPDVDEGRMIAGLTSDLLADTDVIERYEAEYGFARKHLAVIWSLMAFSAGVVESAIVVDRWLWLKEQPEIKHAWVENVFQYNESPRNLCVVGIK